MLANSGLEFSIPSLHDGTTLDCQIKHPASPPQYRRSASASDGRSPTRKIWRHAAIVAHPYAPMGGNFNDVIVQEIVSQLLRQGFIVGTFNFRGAARSGGRTSWTANPERADYSTFVGFMVYYINHLSSLPQIAGKKQEQHHGLQTRPLFVTADECGPKPERSIDDQVHPFSVDSPILLMAGYSYGAMVTSLLEPLQELLTTFECPGSQTISSQIRSCAERLAALQRQQCRGFHIPNGEVDSESRHIAETTSYDHLTRGPPTVRSTSYETVCHSHRMAALPHLVVPRPAYLLVSPLQGLTKHLAAMPPIQTIFSSAKDRQRKHEAAEKKLVENQTLAIFGDRDVFVPAGQLRAWAEKLESSGESRFSSREIPAAGHFWAEEGALSELRNSIGQFASGLLDSN